jgi:hypothetical protein
VSKAMSKNVLLSYHPIVGVLYHKVRSLSSEFLREEYGCGGVLGQFVLCDQWYIDKKRGKDTMGLF